MYLTGRVSDKQRFELRRPVFRQSSSALLELVVKVRVRCMYFRFFPLSIRQCYDANDNIFSQVSFRIRKIRKFVGGIDKLVRRHYQERIKGTEKASPIHTLFHR